MPSRKMRTAIYFLYGLDVEIRPKMDPPELFIHLGGAIGNFCLFPLVGQWLLFNHLWHPSPSVVPFTTSAANHSLHPSPSVVPFTTRAASS